MSDHRDSLDVTPENALRDALARAAKEEPDKAFVILLWDEGGKYETGFHNAGLKTSEAVALLEVMKSRLLGLMS